MKKLIALHLSLALAFVAAVRAEGEPSALEVKRDKKLAEAWLKKADWITDYDAARAEAKKTGRIIFAYFSRSYAP